MGFLELQRQCGVSHEVLRGAQGASHVALGKSGLHAHCEGERQGGEHIRMKVPGEWPVWREHGSSAPLTMALSLGSWGHLLRELRGLVGRGFYALVAVNGGTSFLPSRARIKNREEEERERPSSGSDGRPLMEET